jgi:O-methyltransferase
MKTISSGVGDAKRSRQPFKRLVESALGAVGYRLIRTNPPEPPSVPSYDADGLVTFNKNIEFIHDPRFMSAYRRGMNSGHAFRGADGRNVDLHIEWRVAVCCWAARHGVNLAGDFVECGVNTGVCSLAVCEYVNFNALDKAFYLFDTFDGIPVVQMSDKERPFRIKDNATKYPECHGVALKNFAPYPRAKLVKGTVPETLSTVAIERVAYLSIDMNIHYPERAAIEHFWPKLSPGAFVVLDDYAWRGHEEQKDSLDKFARSVDVEILTLPTGQGLIVKP